MSDTRSELVERDRQSAPGCQVTVRCRRHRERRWRKRAHGAELVGRVHGSARAEIEIPIAASRLFAGACETHLAQASFAWAINSLRPSDDSQKNTGDIRRISPREFPPADVRSNGGMHPEFCTRRRPAPSRKPVIARDNPIKRDGRIAHWRVPERASAPGSCPAGKDSNNLW